MHARIKITLLFLLFALGVGLSAGTPREANASHWDSEAEWQGYARIAADAAREEAINWLGQSRIVRSKCSVNGQIAVGTPGVFNSAYSFSLDRIRVQLEAAGAPLPVALGWQNAFEAAWDTWADNVIIPGFPWYPRFLAYPGPFAPPTPNIPTVLATLPSAGIGAMNSGSLANRIQIQIGSAANASGAQDAIEAFADVVTLNFTIMRSSTLVRFVYGSGPIPTFSLPFRPVGLVLNGSCAGITGDVLSPVSWSFSISPFLKQLDPPSDPIEINSSLNLTNLSVNTEPGDARAPSGVMTVSAVFTNASSATFLNQHFQVAKLSHGNLLLNADGGPGGVDSILSMPDASLGPDHVLSPGESFTVQFEIGLQAAAPFESSS